MSEGKQKYLYICQNCKSIVTIETKYSMPNDIQCPCGLRMSSMVIKDIDMEKTND